MSRNSRSERPGFRSIRTELVAVFCLTLLFVFSVNMYLFHEINAMIGQIETVFSGNSALNELQEKLDLVQSSMEQYLSTKSSDDMEEYFRSQQDFSEAVAGLNAAAVNDADALMEKNIRGMAGQYLALADDTVEARRGRLTRYVTLCESATELCGYLDTCIFSLNNNRLERNTENYGVLLSSLHTFEIIDTVLLAMVGLMNVFLVVLLMGRMTKPLEELALAAGRVAGGELDTPPLEVRGRNEVSVVSQAFNQMVASLRANLRRLEQSMAAESALREKELLAEANLKEAQLQTLQAQINPHFLFNTLNAGAQLAMMEGADRTYAYVQNVADFFRYNVQKAGSTVALRDEVALVGSYVYILNVRFSGEIGYEQDVDESLLSAQMPSMILQPLVENCVKHGLTGMDRPGRIALSVHRDGDAILVRVRDNGAGMDPGTLAAAAEKKPGSGGGVGLYNVCMRLKLFYGRDDVLRVESAGPGLGTQVTVRIPYEEALDV